MNEFLQQLSVVLRGLEEDSTERERDSARQIVRLWYRREHLSEMMRQVSPDKLESLREKMLGFLRTGGFIEN